MEGRRVEEFEVTNVELLLDHLVDQPRLEHDALGGIQAKGLLDEAGKSPLGQKEILSTVCVGLMPSTS